MAWENFIKSRFATFALGAVLVVVMLFAGRIILQKFQVDSEISKLQDQIEKIKKNNEQLSYLVKYFDTPEYQEKQARERLNLKRDGEYVVVLPQNINNQEAPESAEKPNAKQWFNYFFSSDEN